MPFSSRTIDILKTKLENKEGCQKVQVTDKNRNNDNQK